MTSGLSLEAQYKIQIEEGRDNGDFESYTTYITVKENERKQTDYSFDDGRGNYRNATSTLTNFIIRVNGQEIYNSTIEPQNGGVYNGYRVSYIKKSEEM